VQLYFPLGIAGKKNQKEEERKSPSGDCYGLDCRGGLCTSANLAILHEKPVAADITM
jgi:hypothetical protein